MVYEIKPKIAANHPSVDKTAMTFAIMWSKIALLISFVLNTSIQLTNAKIKVMSNGIFSNDFDCRWKSTNKLETKINITKTPILNFSGDILIPVNFFPYVINPSCKIPKNNNDSIIGMINPQTTIVKKILPLRIGVDEAYNWMMVWKSANGAKVENNENMKVVIARNPT